MFVYFRRVILFLLAANIEFISFTPIPFGFQNYLLRMKIWQISQCRYFENVFASSLVSLVAVTIDSGNMAMAHVAV
jgi:hypothetical protein